MGLLRFFLAMSVVSSGTCTVAGYRLAADDSPGRKI